MNCLDCQEKLSLFLDGELDAAGAEVIREHLTACEPCAALCEELAAILEGSSSLDADAVVPPNSQALWCRINNVIESEVKPANAGDEKPALQAGRRWHFSFSQVAAAVAGIAIISSLLTIVGIRNYMQPSGEDFTSRSAESQTTFEKILVRIGVSESPQEARERRLREQHALIDYWNRRVQARKAQWDGRLREAFDRNLQEIDQAVHEYSLILEKDPYDELSGEMLDSALNEKMNLLRQFSEL